MVGRLYGSPAPARQGARRASCSSASTSSTPADRPAKTYSGRHAPPPRPRRRAGGQAARAVPRRADHRPRPAQPAGAVGDDRGARRRGHDRAADHAVPRRGRPPGRPHRGHRPRQGDRRGHAGRAQGPRRRRAARGRARRPGPGRRTPSAALRRWATRTPTAPRARVVAVAVRQRSGAIVEAVAGCDEAGVEVDDLDAAAADARRRLPDAHRPRRRGGRPRSAEEVAA